VDSAHVGSERFSATADAANRRLDRWLADHYPDRSRSEIQRWIDEGAVRVNGAPAKASHRMEPGEVVEVRLPRAPQPSTLEPEAIPLEIIYEDADLLVVNKPAGMVVHPAPGHAQHTLVHAVLHHCPDLAGIGGELRPGIVHRLDKETSGLMVVAKHDRSLRNLQAQFKARTVVKHYLALVEGRLKPAQGRISAPIGRHPTDRKRQAVAATRPDGSGPPNREAVTDFTTLAVYAPRLPGLGERASYSLVNAQPRTGRTHQIRVHFAWLHHPIVGDLLYGPRRPRLTPPRLFLHAQRLGFTLPTTGARVDFEAPLPPDLQGFLDWLAALSA
jgi:23S rRNA pseudouridine1911/1915/1917 synthase